MTSMWAYSRWDGTRPPFELDADALLAELTDDLLYHGDVNAALRRMLQSGFELPDGERVQGLRQMLEELRRRRRERLDQYDLGGVYDEIADELRAVVDTERRALEDLADQARSSGDERRREITDQVTTDRQFQLDMLPHDLAGQVRELQNYEFTSAEARQRFEELMDRLRAQLMQRYVDEVAGQVGAMDEGQLQRMKDMLAELNAMLEARARGEEPDFEGFMDRYGDFFPEQPGTLDELLEVMARRMAAAQAMLASMTPEQRAQLQSLAESLLEDMDLRWQVDQLGENLRGLFPEAGWERRYDFKGQDPLGSADAAELFAELGDLDQLEQMLRNSASPGALAEVDVERARQLLGDDVADSLDRLAQLARQLEDAGLIEQREGSFELTARGMRRIGQNALADLFRQLTVDRIGRHELARTGTGHEREYTTKAYEFGDPFNLHIERTVRNALTRRGGGTPVTLTPEDFEIEGTEQLVRSATVLMLDLSLSMPMRENFLPAKKVAMALHALISTQYPRDYLGIVTFSEVARELRPEQLPQVSWDFVYGTNMQHAFVLSRRMLARQTGTKQIIMITDGEPTAHITASGDVSFHYPPVRETVEATLREVVRCTREQIRINTFMLDPDPALRRFVEQLTALNQGRAFFTTPETLGDYVLVDFIEHKRRLLRGRRTA